MVGVATSFFKAELGAETFPIDESGSVYRGGSAFRPVVARVGGAIKAARGSFDGAGVGAGVEGALSLGMIGGGANGWKRREIMIEHKLKWKERQNMYPMREE